MGEAVAAARALADSDDVFLPDQFSNPANPQVHRETTGPEILAALDGRVDALVAGVGTGGTITGVGEVLRARNPKCRIVAVEPALSPVLSGGAAGAASDPGDRCRLRAGGAQPRADRRGDRGQRRARARARPARRAPEGILAGISSGAALAGALELAARPESAGKRIVVILPDSGERYITMPFFAP
jgi:cysteine synthase A